MKKIQIIIFLFILSGVSISQTIDAYGIKLGIGLSNHSWKYNASPGFNLNWGNNYGITARVFVDMWKVRLDMYSKGQKIRFL